MLDGLLSSRPPSPLVAVPEAPAPGAEAWLDAAGGLARRAAASTGSQVVIDCANGAVSAFAADGLRRLGAEVEVLHADPDGRNINARRPARPTPRSSAVGWSSWVPRSGLAFDGDADRVLAVDETGGLVDGDHLIALFAVDLRRRGRLAGDQVVVTVMTNLGFRLAMAEQGIEVVETAVGDRYVLEALERTGGSLGGEQSGHIVLADLGDHR